MKTALRVLAALLLVTGAVWILQGINVLPGSFMTGQMQWAYYGAATAVVGGLLWWVAGRRDQ